MRRSRSISLVIIPVVVASLAACDDHDYRQCVDADGGVVDDKECEKTNPPHGTKPSSAHPHVWYFSGTPVSPGGRITTGHGSYSPSPGRSFVSPSTRGGFGHAGGHFGAGS